MGELIYSITTNFGGVTPILPQLFAQFSTANIRIASGWIDGDSVHFVYYEAIDVAAANAIVAAYVPDYTPITGRSITLSPNQSVTSLSYVAFFTTLFPGSTFIRVSANSYLLAAGSYSIRIVDKTNGVVLLTGTFTNTTSNAMIAWGNSSTVSASTPTRSQGA